MSGIATRPSIPLTVLRSSEIHFHCYKTVDAIFLCLLYDWLLVWDLQDPMIAIHLFFTSRFSVYLCFYAISSISLCGSNLFKGFGSSAISLCTLPELVFCELLHRLLFRASLWSPKWIQLSLTVPMNHSSPLRISSELCLQPYHRTYEFIVYM